MRTELKLAVAACGKQEETHAGGASGGPLAVDELNTASIRIGDKVARFELLVQATPSRAASAHAWP